MELEDLPVELLDMIATYTKRDRAILFHLNHLWREIILNANKKKRPRIYAKSSIKTFTLAKWSINNNIPYNINVCIQAAKNGQFEIIKLFQEHGYPLHEDTFSAAAQGGHLEVMKWLKIIQCPWSENTCAAAARCGHLEVLQWARQNGCPWNEDTCTEAARGDI